MTKKKWIPKPQKTNTAKNQPFMNRVGKPLTGETLIGTDKPAPKTQPFSKGLTKDY